MNPERKNCRLITFYEREKSIPKFEARHDIKKYFSLSGRAFLAQPGDKLINCTQSALT
jgi:hypothetical protein